MTVFETLNISPEIQNMDLAQLCDHLVESHHAYIRDQGPMILDLLAQVQAQNSQNSSIKKIQDLFGQMFQGLIQHLPKEEQVLFPMAKQLCAATGPVAMHCGPLSGPIGVMMYEHDIADTELQELRILTQKYSAPADADAVVQKLFDALKAFDEDLELHMLIENSLLFPGILKKSES